MLLNYAWVLVAAHGMILANPSGEEWRSKE